MRLATISVNNMAVCVAILKNGQRLDIAKATQKLINGSSGSLDGTTMLSVIESGPEGIETLGQLVAQAEAGGFEDALAPEDAPLLAPIPVIRKNVLCVGRNYAEHIAEGDRAQKQDVGVTEHPVFFTKPPTTITPPFGEVPIFPTVSTQVDYEVELAVIIGKPGCNIAKSDAYDHVFGYSIMNDISARDVQRRHGGQNFKGKALDGSCPFGPSILTADEIPDPHNLPLSLTVNGETRQDGNTADMIFDIPTLIASLSEGMTLEPGDIIATGTPSGVGYAMDPPNFLKDGDTVVCHVSRIGTLTNTMREV
ncbi:fumarylacetoacetate hydrolase family protein [Yoonia sp. 1_MG-2023]|nr:fumarylacetoacetate hydrolase family protein [Yoonia sp. 1_MG-2023]